MTTLPPARWSPSPLRTLLSDSTVLRAKAISPGSALIRRANRVFTSFRGAAQAGHHGSPTSWVTQST